MKLYEPGKAERLDGLCGECFKPALWAVEMQLLGDDGVELIGKAIACFDCGAMTTPGRVIDAGTGKTAALPDGWRDMGPSA